MFRYVKTIIKAEEIQIEKCVFVSSTVAMYFICFLDFCPLGWVSINQDCYYYHGGVLKYNEAYKMCQV